MNKFAITFAGRCRDVCLAILLLAISPVTLAATLPCVPQTLDNYLAEDFSCGVGLSQDPLSAFQWTFFDFDFDVGRGEVSAGDIFINTLPDLGTFGGINQAGFEFEIAEPFNAVTADEGSRFTIEYKVQIATKGIQKAKLNTFNSFSGPPEGASVAFLSLCRGALFLPQCPIDLLTLLDVQGQFGETMELQGFDPVFIVDVRTQILLVGGNELPGGARLDSWTNRFSSMPIPEPWTLALAGVGLLGIGVARGRRKA